MVFNYSGLAQTYSTIVTTRIPYAASHCSKEHHGKDGSSDRDRDHDHDACRNETEILARTGVRVTEIVQPSTVWIPKTSTTEEYLMTVTLDITDIVTVSQALDTIGSSLPPDVPDGSQTVGTTSSSTSELDASTPAWLTSSTYVPSTDTLVYYTQNYIITGATTTFTTELITRTIVPTWSTFVSPTTVITADLSYYKNYISGNVDSVSGSDNSSKKNTIIGGVLGSIGGVLVLVAVFYFLLFRRGRHSFLIREKTFSHNIGRRMKYDDIEELQGINQSKEGNPVRYVGPTTDTGSTEKQMRGPLSQAVHVNHVTSTLQNPFNDEFALKSHRVQRETLQQTSPTQSTQRSSSDSFLSEGNSSSSSGFTESLLPDGRSMSQGYLIELLDSSG